MQERESLRVFSRELKLARFDIMRHLPKNAQVFVRNGQGLVGFGEATRLTAVGAGRIAGLAEAWRELVAGSHVEDQVNLPGSGLVGFGSVAFADSSAAESVIIVPQVVLGLRDGRAWLTFVNCDEAEVEDFWSNETDYPSSGLRFEPGAQSAAAFEASVVSAVGAIAAGEVEKVVLARDLVANVSGNFDLRSALEKLGQRYSSCWVYSVDGTFGASPELLVRVAHGQVSARVLAGTAGRGTEATIDTAIGAALASSHKNRVEHAFAVDSLVQSLAPFCEHVDADSEPFSLPLPNLWHLASDVHGVLRQDSSVLDVAAALHPTAAVAGTTREAALKVIERLEPFDRLRYAGPIGWIGADGDGEWAIALRGAQFDANAATITAFAGCGIVAESEPAAELAETELKFRPITDALS
jgi:menaquinone-specific isochorismate synthase